MPFARWADIVAPSLFVMQAIGRWGNYFNQELYGPPTTLPWGIPIDCAHRIEAYACAAFPETTRFHPLFLYESLSGVLGAVFLIVLGFKLRARLRPGDLLLIFFIWYGLTRFLLEFMRSDNWTFFGVATAQIVSIAFIAIGVIGLFVRHRRGHEADPPATRGDVATWGALGETWMSKLIDEPWAHAGDLSGGNADRAPSDLGIGPPSHADGVDPEDPADPEARPTA